MPAGDFCLPRRRRRGYDPTTVFFMTRELLMKPYCVWWSCLLLTLGIGVTGATRPAQDKPPEVLVAQPLVRMVADYEICPGARIEPSKRVDLKARVTGFLDKIHF